MTDEIDPRFEILAAIHTATAVDPEGLTEAALKRGRELGLTNPQIYELLERSHDEKQIERPPPTESGSGEITYYRVARLTQLGVDVAIAYIRTRR